MEPQIVTYDATKYIETSTRNKVSRESILCGPQNIVVRGNSIIKEVYIRVCVCVYNLILL